MGGTGLLLQAGTDDVALFRKQMPATEPQGSAAVSCLPKQIKTVRRFPHKEIRTFHPAKTLKPFFEIGAEAR
jgi:hypothetical protein